MNKKWWKYDDTYGGFHDSDKYLKLREEYIKLQYEENIELYLNSLSRNEMEMLSFAVVFSYGFLREFHDDNDDIIVFIKKFIIGMLGRDLDPRIKNDSGINLFCHVVECPYLDLLHIFLNYSKYNIVPEVLHYSVVSGNYDMVEILIKFADINGICKYWTNKPKTALWWAYHTSCYNDDIIELLKMNGAVYKYKK